MEFLDVLTPYLRAFSVGPSGDAIPGGLDDLPYSIELLEHIEHQHLGGVLEDRHREAWFQLSKEFDSISFIMPQWGRTNHRLQFELGILDQPQSGNVQDGCNIGSSHSVRHSVDGRG